ncbi:1-phosphofructokinase [Anaerosalibacter massiliensis]|uniref:Tagatose-6-phosphate kinase n=1 Tax=Anaerosalibacter massiliensis TaxID=1347392 RepID=A0A9X2S5L2_9FIRM|nr:1-phosphofructokinase [Anaerosalibacter massiliensis]MCR2044444.1 1-phosphofructokinase [Anaerosalibacter massiliensis]
MILTITLNPSIDRRYYVKGFKKDKVFRAENVQYTPGGKGLNVTRVIKTFSDSLIATGFIGGKSGSFIEEKLDELNINHNFLSVNGETRSCLAIHSDDGSQTEILEKGPVISNEEISNFNHLYNELIRESEIICASGSLPQGLPLETYKDLISVAKSQNKKFILDTSGDALKLGMEASPFLIKPNKDELEKLVGHVITSNDEIVKAAKCLLENDIEIVVVSLGREGAIVFNKGYAYKINVPSVKTVNSVGSGDSMIAGFAISLMEGYDFEYMLKVAAACGAANAMEEETGKVNINNVRNIINGINITKLKI